MRLSRLMIPADLLPIGQALLRCLGQFRLVHLFWRHDSLRLFLSGLFLLSGCPSLWSCCPLLWSRLARLSPFGPLLGCFGLPCIRPFSAA
jgi:hypothetical protein